MNDNEWIIEKNVLREHLIRMEGFVTYLIIDNHIVEDNPILKQKALKILEQLSDFKNHVV